jgi:hypothetical protein
MISVLPFRSISATRRFAEPISPVVKPVVQTGLKLVNRVIFSELAVILGGMVIPRILNSTRKFVMSLRVFTLIVSPIVL